MNQQVRFCTSSDGVRLAYALSGSGPPLVRAPHWFTHLEHDWNSPAMMPWRRPPSGRSITGNVVVMNTSPATTTSDLRNHTMTSPSV